MFDPCGTRRVEGDDIIARLADYLGIDNDEDLKLALLDLLEMYKERQEKKLNGGCPCGD